MWGNDVRPAANDALLNQPKPPRATPTPALLFPLDLHISPTLYPHSRYHVLPNCILGAQIPRPEHPIILRLTFPGLPPHRAANISAPRPRFRPGLQTALHPPRPSHLHRDQGRHRQGRWLCPRRAIHEGHPRDSSVRFLARQHPDPRSAGRRP